MSRFKHISIAVIATAALVGLLASPASARVVNSSTEAPAAQSADAQDIVFRTHPVGSSAADTPLVATVEVGDSSGFDWGSASIGAATVIGLGVLLTGAVLFYRRERHVNQTTPAV